MYACMYVCTYARMYICKYLCIYAYVCMWLDFGKPNELSHKAYFILLAQLITTLIHYPFTVPLPGLADWCAFLEWVLLTILIHDWDNETHGGHYMEGMDLKLTPVPMRHLLGPLSIWLALHGFIASPNTPDGGFNPPLATHLWLPTFPHHPPTHPPTTCHPLYYSSCEKVAQNPAVLAS